MKKLEAFEKRCHRRILKISWADRISTVEVPRRISSEYELLKGIKKLEAAHGHMSRKRGAKYELLHRTVQRTPGMGRKQISRLSNIRNWTRKGKKQVFIIKNFFQFRYLLIDFLRAHYSS